MKKFKVTFWHSDGDVRETTIEAFNKERAIMRFSVNWHSDMIILNVVQIVK
jgi:hypothetical protein